MINLPKLPILIALPLIGLVFIFLSSEEDENAEQSKKSALWTSASNFFLSLYLPINFDKSGKINFTESNLIEIYKL